MSVASVLLFDLGGVLIHTRGFESIKELLAASGQPEVGDGQSLRDRWLGSPSVRDFELGRLTAQEFAGRFVQEWALPITPEAFLEDLTGWIERPYPGAEELLATLRRGYRVCCFSNCNELHWEMMASFLRNFDLSFSSHLLGCIKPDEEAFRAVLGLLEVAPGAVRFLDDSRANVVGAQKVGIKGFLVHGPEEARRVLQQEGLL